MKARQMTNCPQMMTQDRKDRSGVPGPGMSKGSGR
jgi:hypothetical protein